MELLNIEKVTERQGIAVFNNLTELIGNTPLLRLNAFNQGGFAEILCKCEFFNPGSSVKDRIGLAMIEDAENRDLLKPGSVIIEPTSGNTGIGLAMVAAIKGYHIILVMPESMSIERRKMLISLGAEIVLTDAREGMPGAIRKAEMLCENIDNTFMPRQFNNPSNPAIHYRTTGPEIWRATGGKVDVFIAGVGTGGTISGVGRFLKERNPKVQIVAVEPDESAVISGEPMGSHMIQGIGAGFIPETCDLNIIDQVIRVDSHTAIATAKRLARTEGLVVGISAGANVAAASRLAKKEGYEGKSIVTVLPDSGERYVSTLLFYED